MGWGQYANTGIRVIDSHEEALRIVESTKPIRGRSKDAIPLGHRRKIDQFSIRKAGEDVECVLHNTSVVTFRKDGSVKLSHEGWLSMTTTSFIGEVLGINARMFNNSICISLRGKEYRVPEKGLVLLRDEQGYYCTQEVEQDYVHQINRKAKNALMKRYLPFRQHMYRACKMWEGSGEGALIPKKNLEHVEWGKYLNSPYQHRFPAAVREFHALISATGEDQLEKYYDGLLALIVSAPVRYDDRMPTYMRPLSPRDELLPQKFEVLDGILTSLICGIHRDEVFTAVPVELGTLKRDTYKDYFQKGWVEFHDKT
jgi:hypothetical protein